LEYWFYHLEASTIEGVLPGLLEKTRQKGWRALVKLPVSDMTGVERAMVMINGRSQEDVQRERARWKALKNTGATLSYYQQNERGGWKKKA